MERATQLVQMRRRVCGRIAMVFQFEKVSDLKVQIFNLPFLASGSMEGIPSDLVSTGLGYLCHLVNLTANAVGVTLPYPAAFFGSRSTIHLSRVPLYLEEGGGNLKEYQLGLHLLGVNVAYLCYTQGVEVTPEQLPQLFLNMFRCLKSQQLGK